MAINKAMRAALKALSYPDLDVKKNYKLERQVISATSLRVSKLSYRIWDHKVPCGDHEVPVRIFNPPNDPPRRRMLLFFHGGGWVTGNIDSYDRVCATMARLTPTSSSRWTTAWRRSIPSPPGSRTATPWRGRSFQTPALLGVRREDITLIGDSAGGNLWPPLSLMARDRGEFLPRRQILLYPATYNDHSETSPFPSVRENGTDYLLTSKRVCDLYGPVSARPKDCASPISPPDGPGSLPVSRTP